jgi:putative hydrolase of the HAD superfamily
MLQVLKCRSLKLAVISNWDQRLRPLLRRLRLMNFFDVVVVSGEVGFAKPSPAIFEIAAHRLGLPPNEILHVGDEPGSDVGGARDSGFHAVWLARHGRSKSSGRISSLRGLEKRF